MRLSFYDYSGTRWVDDKTVMIGHGEFKDNRNRVKKAEKFVKEMLAVTKELEREAGIAHTFVYKFIIVLIFACLWLLSYCG